MAQGCRSAPSVSGPLVARRDSCLIGGYRITPAVADQRALEPDYTFADIK